jgi:hypothetical protein
MDSEIVKLRVFALAAYSKHNPNPRSPPYMLDVRCAAACALASCGEGPGGMHTMTLTALEQHLRAVCPESWRQLKCAQPLLPAWARLVDGVLTRVTCGFQGYQGICHCLKLEVRQLELQAMEVAVRNASPPAVMCCPAD